MGDSWFRRDGRTMQIGNGQLEVRSENGLATLTLRVLPAQEPFELVEG
jgi:hypothetical protein